MCEQASECVMQDNANKSHHMELKVMLMLMLMMTTMTKHRVIWNTLRQKEAFENARQDSADKNCHDGNTGG